MELNARYCRMLDREVERTRRVVQNIPEGHDDFKPQEKSMPFGQLIGTMVSIPSWFTLILTQDALDINPITPRHKPEPMSTQHAWLAALDTGARGAREAFEKATEAHLESPWTLQARGENVVVMPRADMIIDTFGHLAHHRGQVTVYLRLLGADVPATYGPSADDKRYN